jgi:hypothetical protein
MTSKGRSLSTGTLEFIYAAIEKPSYTTLKTACKITPDSVFVILSELFQPLMHPIENNKVVYNVKGGNEQFIYKLTGWFK